MGADVYWFHHMCWSGHMSVCMYECMSLCLSCVPYHVGYRAQITRRNTERKDADEAVGGP